MKTLGNLGVLLAMSLGMLGVGAAQNPKSTQSPFSVSLRAVQEVVKSGSEVRLEAIIMNTSGHEIIVSNFLPGGRPDTSGHGFKITIRDQNSVEPRLTKLGRFLINGEVGEDEEIGKVVFRHLQPGERLAYDIVISNLFDLNRPGKYTIQVERIVDATRTYVKSNTITVSVVP
jgi:hypothetical protein